MTDTETKHKWRDPLPVTRTFNTNFPTKRTILPAVRCRACKSNPIDEAYAPYCGEWCARSYEACKGEAK